MIRPSTLTLGGNGRMDCRVKPGNDEIWADLIQIVAVYALIRFRGNDEERIEQTKPTSN